MESKEILEGNRLIAEFLGWKFEIKAIGLNPELHAFFNGELRWVDLPRSLDSFLLMGLKYHSDWNFLMPVLEKIEKMGFDSRIMGNNSDGGYLCDFVDIGNNEASCKISYVSKIEAVWNAVIDFIKYYNEQKLIDHGK